MGLLSSFLVATLGAANTMAIIDVSVIVPGRDRAVDRQTVLIEGKAITHVGDARSTAIPTGATRVEGKGKFLMPGLWDMHVHWYEEKSLSLFTANGVVGVRQMFGKKEHLEWRKRISEGKLVGPRMIVESPIVDGADPRCARRDVEVERAPLDVGK